MVGAMVRCALGKTSITEVRQRLRRVALPSNRLVAPAAGLTLVRVQYDRNV
jgi:tRNA U38,U39,U40 pseudouridine synthase TruA